MFCPATSALIILASCVAPFAYQYYKHVRRSRRAESKRLIDELEAGRETLSDLYLSTVKSLATAIAAKDQYTYAHIHRVQHYAVADCAETRRCQATNWKPFARGPCCTTSANWAFPITSC